jgi:hypothetical protein
MTIVLGAIGIGVLLRFHLPDTPIGQSYRRAMVFARGGMFCFLMIPLVPVPTTQARLLTGALADLCFVWTASFLDEFYGLIVQGHDHPRRAWYQSGRQWVTIGLTILVLCLVFAAWRHGESENAARFYAVPFANPFSLVYRLLCQGFVGVCMARSLRYGARFHRISQDPISRFSVQFMMVGNTFCLIALVLGAWTLITPALAPQAIWLLIVDRFCVLVYVVSTLLSNRAFCSHVWTVNAYRSLTELWQGLVPEPQGGNWPIPFMWLRPKVMRLMLRQRVMAIIDARRRLGVVAASDQLLVLEPRPLSWGEQYATAGFAWLEQLTQVAQQEADHVQRVLQQPPSSPTIFVLPPIPHAPRAVVYFHEVVYLMLLAQCLGPTLRRMRLAPAYA